jgi:flavin-dependent dehydrogenase
LSSEPARPGSTSAHRPARAGLSTLLVDRASFPRDKPCGGGVTARAASLLPFSLDPVVEVALASLLHPSRVMLAIPGTSSLTHVEENRQGALVRLTDEHFAALSGAV